jgi:hypothetical protein
VLIATELPDRSALEAEQRLLRAELARVRGRLQLQLALEFAVDVAIALTATAALLVFLDWWLRFGLGVRVALLILSLAALIPFLAVRAVKRWRSAGLDELSLAMTLDRFRPGTGQQIADVLQLPDLFDEASSSTAMVRLAVRQATSALAASDWRTLWNRRRTVAHASVLVIGLIVPPAFVIVAPDAARLSVARWLLGSRERWPQRTYLTVTGLDDRGRLLAPRDERFALEVRTDLPGLEERGGRWIVPGRGEPLALRHRPSPPRPPSSVRVRERTADGALRDGLMVAASPGRFRFEFPPSTAASTFELMGGDDWLGPVTIERVDRPYLAATKLRVKEPGASYEGFRTVEDPRQHSAFLPDTEVELMLVGSEPLAEARLNVGAGPAPGLKRSSETTFDARWTLRAAATLEVSLTSGKTGLASKPAFLSLGLMRDREPRVTLRAEGVGSHVTPVATIPLAFAATDDIGLAALRLRDDRTTSADDKTEPKTERRVIPIPLPAEPGRAVADHHAHHDIVLQADPPKTGTVLRFTGEADDHCARGAQTGHSSVLQIQVVSADELFYEILIRQRAERAKFVAALEAAEKQTPTLAGAPTSNDLLRVMRVHHAGARQIDQIAGRISDTLQEMKLNQVGSPKSHRLLQEGVIDPLRALEAGPLSELRGVLQSLAGASPKTGADRETARKLHGDVVARMRSILEQMSQWESFVDVVNQVAEVIKMQQKVLQATEKAKDTRTREVFDEKP